jgi:hypothetical protein
MELVMGVNPVRLAKKVREFLRMTIKEVKDSLTELRRTQLRMTELMTTQLQTTQL